MITSESRANGSLVPVTVPAVNRLPSKWFADKGPDASPETIRLQAAREVSLGNSWSTREVEEPSTDGKSPPSVETDSSDHDGVAEGKSFAPPAAFSEDPLSTRLAEESAAETARRAKCKRGHQAAAWQQVKASISSLSKAQRRAVEGVYHANGSFTQAAEALGIEESTVRRNFHRGAASLRKNIDKSWRELFPSEAFCSEHDAQSTWQQSRDQVDTRHKSDGDSATEWHTKGFLTGGRSTAMSKLDAPAPKGGIGCRHTGDWSWRPRRAGNRVYVGSGRSRKADTKPKNGRYQGGTAHLTSPTVH